MIPAIDSPGHPNSRFSEPAVNSATSPVKCAAPGKFLACISIARESKSTAPATSNPARAAPKLRPPAPQNRSITFGTVFGIWGNSASTLDRRYTTYRLQQANCTLPICQRAHCFLSGRSDWVVVRRIEVTQTRENRLYASGISISELSTPRADQYEDGAVSTGTALSFELGHSICQLRSPPQIVDCDSRFRPRPIAGDPVVAQLPAAAQCLHPPQGLYISFTYARAYSIALMRIGAPLYSGPTVNRVPHRTSRLRCPAPPTGSPTPYAPLRS